MCNDIRECNKSYFYKMIGSALPINEYRSGIKINFYRLVGYQEKKSSSPDKKLVAQLLWQKYNHWLRMAKRSGGLGGLGACPHENFEKLDPKSCNLSELKVIYWTGKIPFLGEEFFFFFWCIPPSDLSTRTPIPEIWFWFYRICRVNLTWLM